MKAYAVFGNPIVHSQSPFIHKLFAQQIGINHTYGRVFVPINKFNTIISDFFNSGGKGANITLPFKEAAFNIVDKFTKNAKLSKTVNVIKRLDNGKLLGDNTDGIGLLNDLKRLFFIKPGYRILLVGAGGASRSVLPQLLSMKSIVTITNRTFFRAQKLAREFSHVGNIHAVTLENLDKYKFNLIINATSSNIIGVVPDISSVVVNDEVHSYDLSYQKGKTPFLRWCNYHGIKKTADGIGMLVEQAAYSFLLWYGILPEIDPVIEKLKRFNNTI